MSVTQAREIIVRHHKYAWLLMVLAVLVLTGVFFRKEFIQAATYTFTQSSWVGPADTVSTASHLNQITNNIAWDKYSATTTGVTLNGSNYPTLKATSYTFTDDVATSSTSSIATGGKFANGAFSSTATTTSGASVRLSFPNGAILATGGTMTTSGPNTIHTFNSSGTFSVTEGTGDFQYLVVAGGGGGGRYNIAGTPGGGGGGGGGGFRTGTSTVTIPRDYTVTVGAGGAPDSKGGNSAFASSTQILATGGGFGGKILASNPYTFTPGGSGGSGGGGGTSGNNIANNGHIAGAASPTGQGNTGGTGSTGTSGCAGGGGANEVGQNYGIGNGKGGAGKPNPISGSTAGVISSGVYYFSGGGGAGCNLYSTGGVGGGGAGANPGTDGIANTGGGGGGGADTTPGSGANGGSGGSGIVIFKHLTPAYSLSGTFESNVIDLGLQVATFGNMTVSSTTPSGSSPVSMKVQSSANGSTWVGWDSCSATTAGSFSIGSLGCVTDGHRYVKYQATLSTTDTDVTPTLDSVTINYTQYPSSETLTSSIYDTGNYANQISKLSWGETGTSSTEIIKFQMRSASTTELLGAETWCGPSNCVGDDYFTYSNNGASLVDGHPLRSGNNDQYLQYKVTLGSGGGLTPTLSSVSVEYVVNAPPAFDPDYGTNGIIVSQVSDQGSADFGKVSISYKIRDTDTSTGTTTPGYVTPSFYYKIGADWVNITANLGASDTSNKAVASTTYSTYTATWTASSTLTANTASAQVQVRLNDNEGANNTATAESAAFTLDTTAPTVGAGNAILDSSTGGSAEGTVTLTATDGSTLQYRLCNNSDFSADGSNLGAGKCAEWSELTGNLASTTVAWVPTGTPDPETVYLQVRDLYNNITARTITAPAKPTTFLAADVSNPTAGTYGETLSWLSVQNASTYNVYYATTSSASTVPSSYTLLTNTASNVYTHSITTATSSAYWYRVGAVNANSDISELSTAMSAGDVPDSFGTTLPDTTAPVISSTATSSVLSTSAVITIVTDEISSARVYYGITNFGATCASYGSSTSPSTTYSTSTAITLTGLSNATTYHFCVKATDTLGNTSSGTYGGSFTTISGPGIEGTPSSTATANTATINWVTTTSSDSYVTYSTSSILAGSTRTGVSTYTTSQNGDGNYTHAITITGLTSGATYYYKVESTDANGTTISPSSAPYYEVLTTSDTTAPVISATSTPVLASNAAVVVWQTDELATNQVFYDTVSRNGNVAQYAYHTAVESTQSIFHVATLSSATDRYDVNNSVERTIANGGNALLPETLYYVVVKSADSGGYSATSAEWSFTTPNTGDVIVVTSGSRKDEGITPDTTSPIVSNILVSDITPFSAVVSFETDEDTVGFAKYGKDTTYGDAGGSDTWSKKHTLKIRGLTLGTEYRLKASASDKAGNIGVATETTFKTSFLSENLKDLTKIDNIEAFQKEIENTIESILPSLVPPFVSKPIITEVTESGAKISFKTNIKAFPVVVFAEDGAFDGTKENPYTGEVSDTAEKATDHEISMTGLKGNTKYHVQARGFSLPKVLGKSADVTFITKASKIAGSIVERKKDSFTVVWTTDQPTSSIVEYKDLKRGTTERKVSDARKTSHSMKIENLPSGTAYEVSISGMTEQGNIAEGGAPLSVTTSTDTTPPVISGFKVDNALVPGRTDRIQTIVSWITDEPSNGTVYYEEGAGTAGDTSELANKNELLDSYITQHSIILPSLKPGTIYRLKVVSNDDSGNEGTFGPRTVITPRQTESITDIIFKNFEDSFKFLRKI